MRAPPKHFLPYVFIVVAYMMFSCAFLWKLKASLIIIGTLCLAATFVLD